VATKSDFNAEEWETLAEAPLFAGMAVVAAERGGTIRESLAIGRIYAEARQQQAESPLLDALVSSPPSVDPNELRESGGDVRQMATARVREAVATAESKGNPEDVEAYRRFVLSVAEAAANAHKEGGFAGIGGKPVSEAEQAAIDEIRSALGSSG
jgi:hypothetical protein